MLILSRYGIVERFLFEPGVELFHSVVACVLEFGVVVSVGFDNLDGFAQVAHLIALLDPLEVYSLNRDVLVCRHANI